MSNFNHYDPLEALQEFEAKRVEHALTYLYIDFRQEVIEAYAADNNLPASELELSELFDEQVAPLVINQYGADDTPAMSEAFNNWTDGLCKDGEIHEWQYSNYCYVGKYAKD